ncbi:DUF5060 domain-containing protein [Pelagicoccus sp. SDUM812005]|uniref:DUF5060 domain-containing protein n=1 Tax=Pelagicoccus sp. SDUM812005 TaxID=3041257 RepID=UPI00280D0A4C|nr:DUF5060 domain-containing protein [Pelagicoccus sp. SDUM812005]MDQ8180624.1 DUF5060 domain-containing protein [Pelagicoccus sp. SDUM812005]
MNQNLAFLAGRRLRTAALVLGSFGASIFASARDHGDGSVVVAGELSQWHAVTLDLAGPYAKEGDTAPRTFRDYSFFVTFTHESGVPSYTVPGYFAADGDAGNTSADAGTVWRAHLSPSKTGTWRYRTHFAQGEDVAVDPAAGKPLAPYDGVSGSFVVTASKKAAPDFRAQGRLQYVGQRYLRFAGDGSYFFKAGPDAPETMLAYTDFDNTVTFKEKKGPLKDWSPHLGDWKPGDPTWGEGRGKALIGAMNYLNEAGANSVSFLTYNAGGDGDNVWPFVERNDKFVYDCSKLDQWNVVFSHAQSLGLFLHFKTQETENDDQRFQAKREERDIPEALDGGLLGPERKLYYRELVARFGHHLALNWNLGEENTQTYEEQRDMAHFLDSIDAYDHPIVIHTYPNQQDDVYPRLLGTQSALVGASLQNEWNDAHRRTLQWIEASELAGKPWVCPNDEQGPAGMGVPPDPGYKGFDGMATGRHGESYDLHDVRKLTLWGNLMAGGAGVEYYFGYKLPENDLVAQDYRSRHQSWKYGRIAIDFFQESGLPFERMRNADALVGNPERKNGNFCLAEAGNAYLVYLPEGGEVKLDLSGASGKFKVDWFNPREGGKLLKGSVKRVEGGGKVSLGKAPADPSEDWAILVTR